MIGIKVWVYKGEVMPKGEAAAALAGGLAAPMPAPEAPSEPRKPKKPAPKAGARRSAPKEKTEGDKRPAAVRAKKPEGEKPKTAVKRTRKVVKDGEPAGAPAADAAETKE